MSKELSEPTTEEAIKYIADFGGYDKAYRLRSSACFITYKEYLYHKMCLTTFIDYHSGDFSDV